MMTDRLSTTPANVALCALADLPDPGARNFVLQIGARYFHGFVVRRGDAVSGYVDRCPHMGVPLAKTLDDYLTPGKDLIACSWHGALFRPDDGLCVGGPCAGATLTPWPVEVVGGIVRTARRVDAGEENAMTDDRNISTEHQPEGSAGYPGDTLDRDAAKPPKKDPTAEPENVETSDDPGFAVNGE